MYGSNVHIRLQHTDGATVVVSEGTFRYSGSSTSHCPYYWPGGYFNGLRVPEGHYSVDFWTWKFVGAADINNPWPSDVAVPEELRGDGSSWDQPLAEGYRSRGNLGGVSNPLPYGSYPAQQSRGSGYGGSQRSSWTTDQGCDVVYDAVDYVQEGFNNGS